MNSALRSFKGTSLARRVGRLVGPRPGLLIGHAALGLALLGIFAYVVVDSQATSRRRAEKGFGVEAAISAQLGVSIFAMSATSGEAAATKAFGGRTVDVGALTSLAKRSGRAYMLVLDRDGKLIAASRGAPAAVRARATNASKHIRAALEGRSSFSDELPAATGKGYILEWALPFKTPFGRRVEVSPLDSGLIFNFLSSYLARTRGDASGRAYVLDSQNRIVAASGEAAKAGDRPNAPSLLNKLAAGPHGTYREGGVERYFASAPVQGSTWRVVLSEQTSRLYGVLSGSRSWFLFIVLGAFALAGAASLLFFRRSLQTGAKLAENNRALTAVNATLEERVAERTAAAEEHARELARSNEELEAFSSVASHDLQEPLRKIRMFGDRLRERLGDGLPEEPAADLERMQNAAERMQRLINDLLDFSRVTHRGKKFEPVDLGKVTEEVISDLEARVVELNARLDVADLPVIEADRMQMRQLMQNLVGNALKFHRAGEPPVIRIRGELIAGQPPRFSGEAAARDRCVITVEDNGIGFDEKHSERIFAAFERLHSRSAYEGTGIGLAIARKIVWRHGGLITAKSTSEQGATVTVTLPLSHANDRDGGNAQ
ncbi:MAG TPA: ATP-binding protein [Gaiellaceae bacterium]